MLSVYPACFFKEHNGYSVIFPDLNFLATCGKTFEEAFEMAIDCLAGYLYTCKCDNEKIPGPSSLSDIDINKIAKELETSSEETFEEAFVKTIEVDVEKYAKIHFRNK